MGQHIPLKPLQALARGVPADAGVDHPHRAIRKLPGQRLAKQIRPPPPLGLMRCLGDGVAKGDDRDRPLTAR
jgi:hypothetical protein